MLKRSLIFVMCLISLSRVSSANITHQFLQSTDPYTDTITACEYIIAKDKRPILKFIADHKGIRETVANELKIRIDKGTTYSGRIFVRRLLDDLAKGHSAISNATNDKPFSLSGSSVAINKLFRCQRALISSRVQKAKKLSIGSIQKNHPEWFSKGPNGIDLPLIVAIDEVPNVSYYQSFLAGKYFAPLRLAVEMMHEGGSPDHIGYILGQRDGFKRSSGNSYGHYDRVSNDVKQTPQYALVLRDYLKYTKESNSSIGLVMRNTDNIFERTDTAFFAKALDITKDRIGVGQVILNALQYAQTGSLKEGSNGEYENWADDIFETDNLTNSKPVKDRLRRWKKMWDEKKKAYPFSEGTLKLMAYLYTKLNESVAIHPETTALSLILLYDYYKEIDSEKAKMVGTLYGNLAKNNRIEDYRLKEGQVVTMTTNYYH